MVPEIVNELPTVSELVDITGVFAKTKSGYGVVLEDAVTLIA